MSCLENIGAVLKCPDDNAFIWEVPNYFTYNYRNELQSGDLRFVSSPWFSGFNRKWRLAFMLHSSGRGFGVDVGLFLWMMPSSSKAPDIKVKLSVLHDKTEEYQSSHGDVDVNGCFGCWNFLRLLMLYNNKETLSPNGVLRISCILEKKVPTILYIPESSATTSTIDDSEIVERDEESESKPKGFDRLLQNLKSLLLDEQTSDVLLKIEDREFKAHKAILKVRSPVFASMFQPHTKETATGVVDVPDCSASAFEVLLLYIYTGSADTISSDNVCGLYYAADKYQIDDLKLECVEFMINNLSEDNFCDIMTLSLQHNEKVLLEKVTEFFCANVKSVIKTVQWQEYLKNYPTQANELYIKAIGA